MTKRFFYTLTLGLLISMFNFGDSFAQTYIRNQGITEAPSTESILRTETNKFNYQTLNDSTSNKHSYLRSVIEHKVIKRGASTRIKFMFDNRKVTHIEIEGVGSTSLNDIKNGVYIATLTPEKTTLYRINIHTKNSDGTTKVNQGLGNRRIIVVEPKKYDRVMEKIWWLKDGPSYRKNAEKLTKYLNELADGVPEF